MYCIQFFTFIFRITLHKMHLQPDLGAFLKNASGNLQIQVFCHMTWCRLAFTKDSEELSAFFTYSDILHAKLHTRTRFLSCLEILFFITYLSFLTAPKRVFIFCTPLRYSMSSGFRWQKWSRGVKDSRRIY
jgi:hypothetical protein